MKITRKKAVEWYTILNYTKFEMPIKSRFRYMISTNSKILKDEVEAYKAAYPEPQTWIDATKKNDAFKLQYKVKTIEDIEALDEETRKKFDEEWSVIRPELEKATLDFQEYVKERDAFLAEEVNYDLDTVSLDVVPDISADNKQIPHWEIWEVLTLVIKK